MQSMSEPQITQIMQVTLIDRRLLESLRQDVRDAVVKVLRVRFKRVPKFLLKKINLLQDPAKLSQLLEEAVLVKSLVELTPHLD